MSNDLNFLLETRDGTILSAKLVPNSSHSKIVDFSDEYIRIKISAPAIENKANKELISFCSEMFDINKSKIEIISGEKSKLKKILFKNIKYDELTQKVLFVLNSIHKDK